MTIGTKSVLYGAHCFFLHPWFVAAAWWKLFGFPFDPRLWVAFFVHDLGYLGQPNMDGPEGELHPFLGANVMSLLFDKGDFWDNDREFDPDSTWYQFCLFHSRYLCKQLGGKPSRLCSADKLATALIPWWLYLPMVTATGEIHEYLKNAQVADSAHWKPTGYDKRRWFKQLQEYMREWVKTHVNGTEDTWTSADRHSRTASGVWQ